MTTEVDNANRQEEDQLALRVKRGEVVAFVELARRYQRLIKAIACKKFVWRPHMIGLDDLLQLGQIGLWRACQSFRAARGHFVTYAYRIISTAMARGIRHFGEAVLDERGMVKQYGHGNLHLDSVLMDILRAPGMDPEEEAIAKEEKRIATALISAFVREELSQHEMAMAVLRERLLTEAPTHLRELGMRFSRSHERMRQIEMETRVRLRRYVVTCAKLPR